MFVCVFTFFFIIEITGFNHGKGITSGFLPYRYSVDETKQALGHTVCNQSVAL